MTNNKVSINNQQYSLNFMQKSQDLIWLPDIIKVITSF